MVETASHKAKHMIPHKNTAFEIRASSIHGKGIFACKAYTPGDVIFSTTEYDIYSTSRFATVEKSPNEHILDMEFLRWLNHSCQSNVSIVFFGNVVQVVSLSTIALGSELTCDYFSTERGIPIPFFCNCGHCKGILIGRRC